MAQYIKSIKEQMESQSTSPFMNSMADLILASAPLPNFPIIFESSTVQKYSHPWTLSISSKWSWFCWCQNMALTEWPVKIPHAEPLTTYPLTTYIWFERENQCNVAKSGIKNEEGITNIENLFPSHFVLRNFQICGSRISREICEE